MRAVLSRNDFWTSVAEARHSSTNAKLLDYRSHNSRPAKPEMYNLLFSVARSVRSIFLACFSELEYDGFWANRKPIAQELQH